MKKLILLLLNFLFLLLCCSGCGSGSMPNAKKPVTLTMWHVYGSQTKSPLNDAIDEFNTIVGKEQGIVVNVVSVTSSSAIDEALASSANNEPGAEELPDLFTAYPRVAQIVGKEKLLSWNHYFSEEELQKFNEDFLSEGYFEEELLMLPIAKSTEAFFLNKTLFDKFSKNTGASLDELKTFDGLFQTANRYYDWSGGHYFMQINDYYHYALTGMKAYGSEFIKNGELQLQEPAFEKVWEPLARAAIYGGICLDDGYAASRWKTVEIISNIGSTADVLYQPDMVIYPDNTTEDISTLSLPYPLFTEEQAGVIHRGGGLFALKSDDDKKNQAAVIFAKWLTEKEHNLAFTTQTGYLPVTKDAFDLLFDNLDMVEDENYRNLYTMVNHMLENYEFHTIPLFDNASKVQHSFEANVKTILKTAHLHYKNQAALAEDSGALLDELVKSSLEELKLLTLN